MYGCMDGCVYMTEDPADRFCFKVGDLVVTCLESRAHGWCYEGECGPDHWAEMYPVCPGVLSFSLIYISYVGLQWGIPVTY